MSAANESFQAPPPPHASRSRALRDPSNCGPFAIGLFVIGVIVLAEA